MEVRVVIIIIITANISTQLPLPSLSTPTILLQRKPLYPSLHLPLPTPIPPIPSQAWHTPLGPVLNLNIFPHNNLTSLLQYFIRIPHHHLPQPPLMGLRLRRTQYTNQLLHTLRLPCLQPQHNQLPLIEIAHPIPKGAASHHALGSRRGLVGV